ncbi:hypothetical protein LPJ66_008766 [Kickxella alabastrina]|uniref:Uncharacterized protein n=1 Tax=Kickxella alabastrina TaxID=61397 RepID=A0ACC1I5Q3_9FUNG|nr:hypothetical protein LPJ66_008766 [Kickxella alabastrina]
MSTPLPDFMHKFRPDVAQPIINDILRSELTDKRYKDNDMSTITKRIGELITSRMSVQSGFERYKFVTNVSIFENPGQGSWMGTNLVWDPETDNAAQGSFFNDTETLRKLDSFIPVIVYYASKGNRRAPPGTTEFEKWRTVILHTEVVLLEALCFDMVVDHPHVPLIEIIDKLRPTQQLSQMAWNFIADFMRLPICLVYTPRLVAVAAVSLAVRVASGDVRAGLGDDGMWMEKVGAEQAVVREVVQWLLDFYTREAQSRVTQNGPAESNAGSVAQTPASSPGSTMSPMPHAQQHSPSSVHH